MTNKKERYLKVPEEALRRANELGILSDFIFYYQIKSINEEGFFKRNQIINSIQSHIKLSQASVWRKIKRLRNLNLITKNKAGYNLVSYDKFFEIIGYDMNYDVYKKRKGSFKIYKLSLKNVKDLITHIAKEEIKSNLNKQIYKTWQKLKKDHSLKELLRKEHTQPKSLNEIKAFIDRLYNQYDKVAIQRENVFFQKVRELQDCIGKEKYKDESYNLDITLSNKGISKILGYKATSSGFKIQRSLIKKSLIKSERRDIYIESTGVSYDVFRKKYPDLSYILVDSIIYKRLPNKINVL